MTSKISFFKLTRAELRQMNWLTAVQMLVFVLFFPFRALMAMAMRQNEKLRYGETAYTAVDQFCRNVGLGHPENTLLILIAGAVCAMVAFSYMHSLVKQDFYHSLSLKREELFGVKYVSSALTFVMAYLVSQVLVVLVGLIYQTVTWEIAAEIALASVQGILFFLCGYSCVLVAMMLTGNFLTTVLAVGVFALYLPVLMVIGQYLKYIFWDTGIEMGYYFRTAWRFTSPFAWCLFSEPAGREGMTGCLPTVGNLCQLVAIAAVLTLLAVALYRARRTEAAGSALIFRCTEPVIKVMVAVPVALVAALVAYEIFESIVFEILFILLFGALSCVVIEFIYRVDIRQVLSHKWHFAVAAVIACAIFFFFRFDLAGYNTYLPAEENIESMSISHDGSSYVDYSEDGKVTRSYSVKDRLDELEWEEFDRLYEVAENGVENVRKYSSSYNIYEEEISTVYLKYHLKDGREMYRRYEVDSSLYIEVMDELMKDEEFLEQYFRICAWDEDDISKVREIYCWFYGYSEDDLFGGGEESGEDESDDDYYGYQYVDMDVPYERMWEVIEAYCEDLREVPFEEIYRADGELDFFIGEEFLNNSYPLSPAFSHTMAVLKEIYTHPGGQ